MGSQSWTGLTDWTITTTVCCDHIAKGFGRVNEAKLDAFLEFPCFLCDPADVGHLIPGSSTFSKSSLYIWEVLVHILLKPSLKNSEHYFASIWDECNCAVIWTFFGLALLWDWNENWPFPVLWPLLHFPNLLLHSVTKLFVVFAGIILIEHVADSSSCIL